MPNLDEFTRAYIECALWSSTANGAPEDTGDGTWDTSFDSYGCDIDDIARDTLASMIRDCRAFQRAQRALLERAGTPEQNGHDYWLTRNHHGAGFWDRGYPASVGDALTKAAHADGSRDLYFGDDQKIYQA